MVGDVGVGEPGEQVSGHVGEHSPLGADLAEVVRSVW
jgi:hypothetical protein